MSARAQRHTTLTGQLDHVYMHTGRFGLLRGRGAGGGLGRVLLGEDVI